MALPCGTTRRLNRYPVSNRVVSFSNLHQLSIRRPAKRQPNQMTTTTSIHVRIPSAVHSAAQRAAKKDDRTLSYIVRKALETYLEANGHSIDQL